MAVSKGRRRKVEGGKAATPAAIDRPADDRPSAPAVAESTRDKRLRQNLPPPVCPYHQCETRANHSDPLFTRYYCPEPGCGYSQKVPRPQIDEILRRREQEDFSAR